MGFSDRCPTRATWPHYPIQQQRQSAWRRSFFGGIASPYPPGQTHRMGKVTATNSIEREFKEYIDKKGALYPRDVRYAWDPKAWHTQRVFDKAWVPHVWRCYPGRGRLASNYRQPNTVLQECARITASPRRQARANLRWCSRTLPSGVVSEGLTQDQTLRWTGQQGLHVRHGGALRRTQGVPRRETLWVIMALHAGGMGTVRSSWEKASLLLSLDG